MKLIAFLFFLFFAIAVQAQSTAGITHIPDTSFTNASELRKQQKNYPSIKLAGEFKSKTVKEKRNITYCNIGQRKLLLDAFYPSLNTKQLRPAIMIIHGGGWRSGNRTQHYPLAQKLANLGYVCFTPEYRLSTEALYPAAIHDLKSALGWIHANAKTYSIDTNKITVLGFSAGGELAAFLGTTIGSKKFEGSNCNLNFSSNFQALVDIDGTLSFVHPESGEGDDSKKTSAATHWLGYSKKDNPVLWQAASPLTHVGKNTPPTLFLNSSVVRMHAGREDFIKVLDEHTIYSEIQTFEGSPHSFVLFDPWFDSVVQTVDVFLKKVFMDTKTSSVQKRSVKTFISKVWVADNGDGTYKNPILHADYSDPDAIRVGDDFYMTASSFEDVPGLPILHSKDLVNWTFIGHALKQLVPKEHFSTPRHGEGVWAPSIRYHNGEFYIYYPDPDFGIYLVKAKNAGGPWSEPILVEEGKGLIDPCPLWDDDGNLYIVHAFAGSRAGIKSIIVVKKLNKEGTNVIDDGVVVYDGHEADPTIEGPKFYKRNGYYYIFAPAGGVATGWQTVLRSKNIYGPYERKVVMDQGTSAINGPHQGALVTTQTGEDWFLHFQDKDAYGRIVHLQPMKWKDNWPVIGEDKDGDGKGEPVLQYKKPNVGKTYPIQTPVDSDEFDDSKLGLQWQWMANTKVHWYFMDPSKGVLRLFSAKLPDSAKNLWDAPNVLLQKFPAPKFTVTAKISFHPNTKLENENAGLTIMGLSYASIALKSKNDGIYLVYSICRDAGKGNKETETVITKLKDGNIYLSVSVLEGGKCSFSYSLDGKTFTNTGEVFTAEPGRWIGAKVGLFCTRETQTNDSGWMEVDWWRVE